MAKSIFKVRDKTTGTFWNGDFRWSKFNDKGRSWSTKTQAEGYVSYVTNYRRNYPNSKINISADNWEIVEYEVIEKETAIHDITTFIEYCKFKEEVTKIDAECAWFVETMHRKGVIDQIQFIFKLRVPEGQYRCDMEDIKAARACLRQLGVKTRTFRESQGIFGMMDREQALRARLTLDVDKVIDLAELRTKLGI